MKKRLKKVGIMIGVLLAILAVAFIAMVIKSNRALANQVNVVIDMNQVADGTYIGESDGGMVNVKVSVEVKNHEITNIDLLEHKNGKGKKAEVMLDWMVEKNTDDVDEVSGATTSSKTLRNAVNKALQQGLK